jgi:hypothetical protein
MNNDIVNLPANQAHPWSAPNDAPGNAATRNLTAASAAAILRFSHQKSQDHRERHTGGGDPLRSTPAFENAERHDDESRKSVKRMFEAKHRRRHLFAGARQPKIASC